MSGYFLALEGPDGSGKSTIGNLIKEKLIQDGFKCISTREPGGTKIGEEIRNILLSNENTEMSSRTEALLYAASRAQHVEEKIKPLKDNNNIIICDRYIFSSLAYQGFSRNLGLEDVMDINQFAINGCYPDRILFFDINPEEALKRKFVNREGDRLEIEGEAFHKRVFEGYKEIIKKYPENVTVIDANKSVEEVYLKCIEVIMEDINEINNINCSR